MRKPFVAGNWKMNTTESEARGLSASVAAGANGLSADVALCVPFPYLATVSDVVAGSAVGVGAQDVFWEPKGAFTGEVSTTMLADYCQYVIIGHSERRQFFGETNEVVQKKLRAVLASPLDPIVCVGELLEHRRAGQTNAVLKQQLHEGFAEIVLSARVTVAYEPVWAIGTGETATPEQAPEACRFIRAFLNEMFDGAADAVRIQYGGSVNAENATTLLSQPDIDGALVGGASLKADQFLDICRAALA